jgi:DNA-binding MarR family transcriptional regulator
MIRSRNASEQVDDPEADIGSCAVNSGISAAQRSGLSLCAVNVVTETPQQHQALLAAKGFSGSEPTTVGDLAHFLLIRHHTAVELVNRMTRLGLLTRTVDAADRRRVLVSLSARGERKLRALSKIHLEELRSVGPALGKILRLLRQTQRR